MMIDDPKSTITRIRDNGGEVEGYRGYTLRFERISYNCPALGLYGFATEGQLKRAIDRKLDKLQGGK